MPYFDPRQLNRAGMYSGLLRQPRGGINLLGMNLPAGRNTLVARPDDAPNAAAASAIRGYVGRNASPQRRSVQNIFGAPRGVTDILGRLNPQKYGPVMEGPQKYGIGKGGPDRFRSPIVSQDLARQMAAVAGIPAPTAMGGANVLAGSAGQFLGRRGEGSPMTARPTEGDAPEGPQSFMGKIGGFLKRPGMGESMMAAGARMMQGSPEGTLATIGHGLETGLGAYGQAKTARQLEEDRGFAAEERARDAEDRANKQRVNETIQEITGGWDENTTIEQRVSDLQRAANVAFGNADAPLGRGLLEEARDIGVDPAGGSVIRYETWDQTEGRAPDGITPTRVREVTAGAPGTIGDRSYFDPQLYADQVSQGIAPAVAARNSWATGGMIVDPVAQRGAAEKVATQSEQERLNQRLGEAAHDALMLMVVDPATVDPETGETIPGQPNYADYYMAGATPIRNPLTGAIAAWEQGSPGTKEGWQSFLASLISNAGSETAGFGSKLLGFFGRSVFLRDNPEILAGYTNALNYINPTVRFLSGAQMTNQEAMRYYNALIPAPGDPIEVIELKRRKRDVLTNAMGGPGISDAARQRAREMLGLDEDELMVHEHGAFGGDASGRDAADYYLARLTRAIGVTDITDYGAVIGQVDDRLATDRNDPGAFVPRGGN